MIAEIGHFSLLIALCITVVLALLPLWGWYTHNRQYIALAPRASMLVPCFIGIAYASLTIGFIEHDFSITYVANNSNTQLPLQYRISGVWGSHEGSMLLWNCILSCWVGIFAWKSKHIPLEQRAIILAVLGSIQCGFLLFSVLTSNPFIRLIPAAIDGNDLNPLLQDPGMAIHPPTLYIGYVGFAIPFAFAVGALIQGKLDDNWAKWLSPWTKVAWAFLTLGITLGSWWAYNELGWGGWWFWDPVENASFMPWLIGTALVHSLAATEKRGVCKAWTLFLSLFAFALSLVGAFLVRSGILTSVHAFASDADRGLFILVLLSLVIGISLTLYALRSHMVVSHRVIHLVSRESALLINNLFLVVITLSVLIGTLYPLLYDAFGLGKLSVGPPYFNKVITPLAIGLFITIGFASHLHWGKNTFTNHIKVYRIGGIAACIAAILFPLLNQAGFDWRIIAGSSLASWISITGCMAFFTILQRNAWHINTACIPIISMTLGHLGVAIFVIGVSFSSANSLELVQSLSPGDTATLRDYRITYQGIKHKKIANYQTTIGQFSITQNAKNVGILEAEKRFYPVQQTTMTEAAIRIQPTHDLFIALGEKLNDDSWSVRIQYKSYIRCIWAGALLITIAALLSLIRPRLSRTSLHTKKHACVQ